MYSIANVFLVLLVLANATALPAVPPNDVAVGDWSKPVADSRGYQVRGRLVLAERRISDERREFALYIELQDAMDGRSQGMRIFCDLDKTDLSGKTKTGLTCVLQDPDGKPVESAPFAFGGGVPASEWIFLPADATIRLRASPFGVYRPGAMAICPHPGAMWVIEADDSKEYSLGGTFVVDPEEGKKDIHDPHVWRGTIELPPLKITGRR